MQRYQRLLDMVLTDFHAISLPALRHAGIAHTMAVCNAAGMLALRRHLEMELCSACALLHDLSLYTQNCRHLEHAKKSAALAVTYLREAGFYDREIEQIQTAIANHSYKEQTDDALSELIKDADVLGRYLQDAQIPAHPARHKRLVRVIKELNLL